MTKNSLPFETLAALRVRLDQFVRVGNGALSKVGELANLRHPIHLVKFLEF